MPTHTEWKLEPRSATENILNVIILLCLCNWITPDIWSAVISSIYGILLIYLNVGVCTSWNALKSLRLLHRTGRYSKVLTGELCPSQGQTEAEELRQGVSKSTTHLTWLNQVLGLHQLPWDIKQHLSLTWRFLHHRHLVRHVPVQNWILQMTFLTVFFENVFAFISPFKFKAKTCLFVWGSQHYPGLNHGSHRNVKETFVTYIQKIYLLVIFKLNFCLLWYIFSSLVCLLDISNTVKLAKLRTNQPMIWKCIFKIRESPEH